MPFLTDFYFFGKRVQHQMTATGFYQQIHCVKCDLIENFEIFKNHEGDFFQKLPESIMWLLVNHTKSTNILY